MTPSNFEAFFYRLSSATPIKTQVQLANELNVGRAAISLAKQKDTIPSKWILKLSQKYGINSEWLSCGTSSSNHQQLSSKSPGEYFNIPKIDSKLDKNGTIRIDEQNPLNLQILTSGEDTIEVSAGQVYLQMQGPSMEPEIKNRDYIIIDQELTAIYAGNMYAVAVDGQILIRRIEKGPGVTILQSENSTISSFQIQDKDFEKIKVIGKVINIIRKYI